MPEDPLTEEDNAMLNRFSAIAFLLYVATTTLEITGIISIGAWSLLPLVYWPAGMCYAFVQGLKHELDS